MKNNRVYFFDYLRAFASIAVVIIHVVGPYRYELNNISIYNWLTAIGFNSLSRWAVPIFIMISGALLISDPRKFSWRYFLHRRISKVVIPFIFWSIFYAILSGLTPIGFNWKVVENLLEHAPIHETYYHLGFFYYFIPIYFAIPFIRSFVEKSHLYIVIGVLGIWFLFTVFYLFKINNIFWSNQYVLYSGYLLLGYYIYKMDNISSSLIVVSGIICFIATFYMTVIFSISSGVYTTNGWTAYKSINTVLIAIMIFQIAYKFESKIKDNVSNCILFISKYSLGIYLIHPIFLWPVRTYDLYFGPAIFMIILWTLVAFVMALLMSYILGKHKLTAWAVP